MSWLYVAHFDGFDLGKIDIPMSELYIYQSIYKYLGYDESNRLVYFDINLSQSHSSIKLLSNLFTVVENKYYHCLNIPHERNIKILKVEIDDAKEGNNDTFT